MHSLTHRRPGLRYRPRCRRSFHCPNRGSTIIPTWDWNRRRCSARRAARPDPIPTPRPSSFVSTGDVKDGRASDRCESAPPVCTWFDGSIWISSFGSTEDETPWDAKTKTSRFPSFSTRRSEAMYWYSLTDFEQPLGLRMSSCS